MTDKDMEVLAALCEPVTMGIPTTEVIPGDEINLVDGWYKVTKLYTAKSNPAGEAVVVIRVEPLHPSSVVPDYLQLDGLAYCTVRRPVSADDLLDNERVME